MNRIALALTLLCACDGPNIDGKLFKCQTHADCGAGFQCVKQLGSCVQADNNVNGVFSDRLVFGMSAALDETTAIGGIGAAAKRGILTYFNKVNNQGGVNGRRLELISEDDKYDATQTTTIVSNWTNGTNRKIFGVAGVIGTEPSLAAREVLIKNKVLFYAPATGYEGLEPNPPDRYVFNTRVRYNQEAEQLTAYAINTLKVPPPERGGLRAGDRGGRRQDEARLVRDRGVQRRQAGDQRRDRGRQDPLHVAQGRHRRRERRDLHAGALAGQHRPAGDGR